MMPGTASSQTARSPKNLMDPEDPGRDWGLSDFDAKHNFVFHLSYPLPFQADSRALRAILSGWTVSSISTLSSGHPFTARLSQNNSRDGDTHVKNRPDLRPGADNNPVLGGPDKYYDPGSFSLPLPGTYGNLGRNTLIGPGLAKLDLSLGKSFPLGEGKDVNFRAEMFNLLNRANFNLPNTAALTNAGAPNPSAGRVRSTVTSSRQIQFALKINF